ncbi:MAG: hypothetical protein GXP10_01720 [Gammaproteobacteria bacterium]|nr:hypothetical protein [Gammaproteobacteria bacterium]
MDYYDIKADVEVLLALTADPCAFTFTAHKHPALHSGQSALIRRSDGEIAGIVGALHPALAATLGIGERALLFELEWQVISRAQLPAFQALSKYPAIRRDIAVVVDEKISSLLLCQCVEKTAGPLLRNLQLFDLYQGKGIDSGRKSMALALTLQATSRTLTDGEVDELIDNVLVSLEKEFGAELRG